MRKKNIDIVNGFTFLIKSKIWILYAVFTIIGCANESKPTGDYRSTISICNNLYIEAYTFYATGVYSSEIVGDYLTDSSTFRVYIGKFDNGTQGLSLDLLHLCGH